MKKFLSGSIAALCLFAAVASPSLAQDAQMEMTPEMQAGMQAMMKAMMPGEAHQGLAEGVGTFKLEFKSWMEPGSDPMEFEGMAKRQMTNGNRILEERVTASMMGMPFEGTGQSGYDNVTGEYWSTWTDNMSTGVWISNGAMDDGGVMTFRGDNSDPMTGGKKPMKVVIHPEKDGTQLSEFYTQHEGKEHKMMEISYIRQK